MSYDSVCELGSRVEYNNVFAVKPVTTKNM